MNFDTFQQLYQINYGEVKIIGREINLDGKSLHIIAMTKQKHGEMYLYALEEAVPIVELARDDRKKTNRESMVTNINTRSSLHIQKIKVGNCEMEMQGSQSGVIMQGAYEDSFLFLVKMIEQGWKITEQSSFYKMDWKKIMLTAYDVVTKEKVQQLAEMKSKGQIVPDMIAPPENLPDFDKEIKIEITLAKTSKTQLLQIPIKLEIGGTQQITFLGDNGKEIVCYINEVKVENILEETQKHFADKAYREKMLQYCTEQEFEEHCKSVLETLYEDCPQGMCYISVTYECTSDVALQFYTKEYLETIPEPKNHCSSLAFLKSDLDLKEGPHGLKNRFWMMQNPVPQDTKSIDAELFTAIWSIPEKIVTV